MLKNKLFVYLKHKLMGCLCMGCLFAVKKIPTVLTGGEKTYLLLAAALLSTVTRLCACTQLVAALMVKTEDMLPIRSRCYDFRLC